MEKIRKFFDAEGKESEPENAISCHELEIDDTGKVIRDIWYEAKEEAIIKF